MWCLYKNNPQRVGVYNYITNNGKHYGLIMSSIYLLFGLIVVLGLAILVVWLNSPYAKGKAGEKCVHNILMKLPDDYCVMDDIVLNTVRGTTQIDHIVISQYGVFVIETKNYSGDIYGNDESKQWVQKIVTEVTYRKKWWKTYTYVTTNKFYNPVKQCWSHLYEVKNSLKEWPYLKIVPIVVFVGSADLSKVQSKIHVVYDNDLLATIQSYKTTYLSKTDIQKVIERLTLLNAREYVDERTHVRNIRKAQIEMNKKVSSGICPVCGGNLVFRSGKYGSFYGCSNYPNCTFKSNHHTDPL